MEHLPFNSHQRKDRHVDNRNDQDAKEHWAADLFTRGEHRFESLFPGEDTTDFALAFREPANDVFDDHHSTIDDQPEIHGAKAHEISRNAKASHADNREQE